MKRSVIALTVVALAGCTTPLERRQASGGFDYQQEQAGQALVIPATLQQPSYNTEFDIPAVGDQTDSSIIGKRVDVRPPLQVMPLAQGTRLQDNADSITVLIESNDDDRDLRQDINDTLLTYLGKRDIKILTNNNGVIQTDWIENEEEVDKSWWSKEVYHIRQRYQFDTQVKDHGRSGSITISVIDHEEGINVIDDSIVLADADRRRYAIDMLNGAISYLNYERKKQQVAKDLANGKGFNSELGFDAEGNSAFIANASFERVWTRMPRLLPAMGFQVRDLDEELGTIFVEYEAGSGFWQNLWGNNDTLPIDDGAYQVKMAELGETTSITFFDADVNPLSAEKVTGMANTFKELVKKELDDL
ncbi:outer membrane protein assembly factor BamC [Ferrimonas lipolytica]|uniref:Outer membrane protein assembly factor BamC n=1 Tax=Ferrimonas lipolytica TaxID=2724191 RepID=A0A6H1UCS4_9GAMM|nr:outer membrane protein assembly factor BamC [Ferrimonas lipolytica]QIZ76907.1 outer membrane protein assembly factor BamC [Ferrimonas lipolytica]